MLCHKTYHERNCDHDGKADECNDKKTVTWSCVAYAKNSYRKTSNIRGILVGNNCRSLRCSWSIACRRCSNYIFILDLTSSFKGFGKDSRKTLRESFKCWDLVRLILETWRYLSTVADINQLRYGPAGPYPFPLKIAECQNPPTYIYICVMSGD